MLCWCPLAMYLKPFKTNDLACIQMFDIVSASRGSICSFFKISHSFDGLGIDIPAIALNFRHEISSDETCFCADGWIKCVAHASSNFFAVRIFHFAIFSLTHRDLFHRFVSTAVSNIFIFKKTHLKVIMLTLLPIHNPFQKKDITLQLTKRKQKLLLLYSEGAP